MMFNMRFKGFVWPNNPYSYTLTSRRNLATHSFPGRGYCLEDLGQGIQILQGEGEFYGTGAYQTMRELMEVFREGGTGVLVHPVIQMRRAVFKELELIQEPREDYVRYRFVFWENGDQVEILGENTQTSGSYGVQAGETLWEIAQMYDTTVEALLKANSWIQNPNQLTAGRRVVIP